MSSGSSWPHKGVVSKHRVTNQRIHSRTHKALIVAYRMHSARARRAKRQHRKWARHRRGSPVITSVKWARHQSGTIMGGGTALEGRHVHQNNHSTGQEPHQKGEHRGQRRANAPGAQERSMAARVNGAPMHTKRREHQHVQQHERIGGHR